MNFFKLAHCDWNQWSCYRSLFAHRCWADCSLMTSVLKNSLRGDSYLKHGLMTHHVLKRVLKATVMRLLGAPHPGWDGDGRDGPGDQHERNHHTGGHPEQDGEVWGKHVSAPPSWLDSTSDLWGFVYSMQACVYAAPCMLLSSNCGCSLPTLECLCSSFRPLLSPLHCSQRRPRRDINSPEIAVLTRVLHLWILRRPNVTIVQCIAVCHH